MSRSTVPDTRNVGKREVLPAASVEGGGWRVTFFYRQAASRRTGIRVSVSWSNRQVGVALETGAGSPRPTVKRVFLSRPLLGLCVFARFDYGHSPDHFRMMHLHVWWHIFPRVWVAHHRRASR